MISSQQMAKRAEIASDVLGTAVNHGDTMRCLFEDRHSHASGPRDLRICLEEKGDFLPTFMCFHSSCKEAWAPLNKELRRRIWFAEHGRDPDHGSVWAQGGVKAEPKAQAPGRLKFDLEALRSVQRKDWRVDAAWLRSRSVIDPDTCTTAQFLDRIFLPDEKVLIFTKFKSQGQFVYWVGRGFYRLAERPGVKAVPSKLPAGGPEGMWYLCAPVDGKWHPNTRAPLVHGQVSMSRRSQESVTAWRYMVLESDEAPQDLWLNFLAQVPLPIAAIYTSAGKSVHALVRIDASSKIDWDRYKKVITPLFTKLGADGAALTAVRLTRLPGCLRGNRMQQLLYLNPTPEPNGQPIGMGGAICG